jgi:predicted phage baseplate assembly protein
MPLVPPSLDDRRFDDLVDDLLARIPAHAPEWTDPRPGDPGRTLIELFAYLGDALLYRANLVPPRQRLVFLKLLGMGLRPARPARGLVALQFARPTETAVHTLRPRARLAGPQPFETLDETTVLPVSGEAYLKRSLPDAELARRADVLAGLARIHRIGGPLKGYQTTPAFDGGRAEPQGLDVFASSTDRALWIALLAPPADDAADQPALNEAVRSALGGGDAALPPQLCIGVVPALQAPALFESLAAPAPVPVLWEVTGRRSPASLEVAYTPLSVVPGSDHTGGLVHDGTLRLQLPDESALWAPPNDVGLNPNAGVGDAPPRLDDPARAARLVTWLRLRPLPGPAGETALQLPLAWIGVNAVRVDQRVTQQARVLGVSNGQSGQVLALPGASVDPDTLQVEVEEPRRGYQPWVRVDDLGAIHADPQVARDARVFELDAEAGTLRFGDGVRGRVPEAQMRIRLALGRFGGGRAGNLPAGTLAEIDARHVDNSPAPPLTVWQPLPLSGGEDAETLAQAEQRIPARLRHGDRAVTADDFRQLARETPAVDLGRVEVLPMFKPADRRFGIPGVVSVLALPAAPIGPAPNPRPDRPLIERVHAHLSARVPLATELYVIGCEYLPLALTLAVEIREGHGRDQVLHEVRETLRRMLWPLDGGGHDGRGWPLGRPVRSRELEVEVARVPGVDELRGLRIFVPDGDSWRALPQGGDGAQQLTLQRWQLPELLAVVAVDGPSAPTDVRLLPNPHADAQAVAVPLVPETC